MTHGNTLRMLPEGSAITAIPHVHPKLHLLRGETHSTPWTPCDTARRVQSKATGVAQSLGGLWTQRDRNQAVGKGRNGRGATAITEWPGKGHGIREPQIAETPLSWAEVCFAIRDGLV
jgi:hypothetical protein